jgi:hypothetical protein
MFRVSRVTSFADKETPRRNEAQAFICDALCDGGNSVTRLSRTVCRAIAIIPENTARRSPVARYARGAAVVFCIVPQWSPRARRSGVARASSALSGDVPEVCARQRIALPVREAASRRLIMKGRQRLPRQRTGSETDRIGALLATQAATQPRGPACQVINPSMTHPA